MAIHGYRWLPMVQLISVLVESSYATLINSNIVISLFPHFRNTACFLLKTATSPIFHVKFVDVRVGL